MVAVANGNVIPLSAVPDEAFSGELLGKGFAIEPTDGMIYSPITGQLQSIAPSRHAYTVFSEDGLDVLIHIGIDSVTLNGEGFFPLCEEGARVSAGDALAKIDLEQLRRNGCTAVTAGCHQRICRNAGIGEFFFHQNQSTGPQH